VWVGVLGKGRNGGREEGKGHYNFKYTVTQDKFYSSIYTKLKHQQKTAIRTT
jgi:hypothetical protein